MTKLIRREWLRCAGVALLGCFLPRLPELEPGIKVKHVKPPACMYDIGPPRIPVASRFRKLVAQGIDGQSAWMQAVMEAIDDLG